MVNDWLAPELTVTAPDGLIAPLAPAEAVMVKVSIAKVAEMEWSAVMLEKV